jgi:hypothetical protein
VSEHDELTPEPGDRPHRRASDRGGLLEVLHKWGPWLGALFLFVVLTTGKTVLGYADKANEVERLAERITALEQQQPKFNAALDALSNRILRRLDRLDKATARIACKLDGPGASCDAAMAAIGSDP